MIIVTCEDRIERKFYVTRKSNPADRVIYGRVNCAGLTVSGIAKKSGDTWKFYATGKNAELVR